MASRASFALASVYWLARAAPRHKLNKGLAARFEHGCAGEENATSMAAMSIKILILSINIPFQCAANDHPTFRLAVDHALDQSNLQHRGQENILLPSERCDGLDQAGHRDGLPWPRCLVEESLAQFAHPGLPSPTHDPLAS
jgi:hypothetical protein